MPKPGKGQPSPGFRAWGVVLRSQTRDDRPSSGGPQDGRQEDPTANLPQKALYIGGRFVDARSDDTFETLNPATGKPICAVQAAGGEDVERAVRSARDGFAAWSATTGAERGRILNRAAGLLRDRNDTSFGLAAGVFTRDHQRGHRIVARLQAGL